MKYENPNPFQDKEISEMPLYRLKKELRILKSKYSNKIITSDNERVYDLYKLDIIEVELKKRLSELCSEKVVKL